MSIASIQPPGQSAPPARDNLAITYVPIDQLVPDPKNARRHVKTQIGKIAKSIQSFGFNVPILVDAGLNIIAGHGRLLAAKRLGWREVPTIQLGHLSDAQRRAFMIADNRLTEIASWDDRLLALQLKELAGVELDFDLDSIGFEMAEIDLRIESLTQGSSGPGEPPVPVASGPAVSCNGDLWLVGRHKVLCGSALAEAAYEKLLGSERAAVVFTDPPYNVPIDGHVSGLGKTRHREFLAASGEMDSTAFTQFLATALSHMAQVSHPGSLVYTCMDWRHMRELLAAASAASLELFNLCVWTKPNGGMGSFYRSQHELVFVFKSGAARHCNNIQLGKFGRNRSNVWAYAPGPGFGRADEEGRLAALHPTIKPVALVVDALLDSSRRGDIVLDPFLGSGATLMAAERTGRKCIGTELDPLYVDLIVRRWQA